MEPFAEAQNNCFCASVLFIRLFLNEVVQFFYETISMPGIK